VKLFFQKTSISEKLYSNFFLIFTDKTNS